MKTIKKIALLVSFSAFFSCDKEQCSEFLIENTITIDLIMLEYTDGTVVNNLTLDSGNRVARTNKMCDTNSPPGFTFFPADSIEIRDNEGIIRRTYFPFDEGRNIFSVFDPFTWEVIQSSNDFIRVVFFIREEDIAHDD